MMIGQAVGAYIVLSKLGEGGMGAVYRARDTKLNRDVALKILPESFADDGDRLARFTREAQTLAALNHPNIAQIYGLEDGPAEAGAHKRALVMELVEGEELAQRIARGALPIDDAVPIARQIAEALEAAHEQGIIHRDLKPANIKVRPDGTVKVLDFGLAKALDAGMSAGSDLTNRSNSPTIASPPVLTGGMILGTAAYMAPEQATGKRVDKRSDIWAFGVVLYEMLTGQPAFAGDNVSEILASVLRDAPPLERLPPTTPERLRALVARCLDRDAKTRLRDIGEARVALSGGAPADVATSGDVAAPPASRWHTWAAAAAGLAVGALVVTLATGRRDPPAPAALRMLPITVDGLDLATDRTPVLSPDGQRIVYSANGSLWLRELSRVDAQPLPDTDGAAGLFWSPDSTRIGFLRRGRLWTMPVGGQATSIAVLPGAPCGEPGGLWRTDGRILYSLSCNIHPLFQVSDAGGDLTTALAAQKPEERDFHHMTSLPNGTVILTLDRANAGIDTFIAWDGTTRKTILQLPNERLAFPVYSPSGHLLYQRTTTNAGVWAVPFSADRLEVTGEAFLVAPNVGAPSMATDGTLLVGPLTATGTNQLAWIDRSGRIEARIDEEHPLIEQPSLSPDGRRVAFQVAGGVGGRNIWIRDLADGTRTQITTGPELKWRPFWSPDGKYIYYDVEQPGRGARMERQSSAGGGKPETIVDGGRWGSISADGRWLAYASRYSETAHKLFTIRLDGDRAPSLLADTPGRPDNPTISPDQRYIAYAIVDSMTDDGLYVRRFPEGTGQWKLDTARGSYPRWSRKGDRLYFSRENEIWEIDVRLGDTPTFGRARRLFAGAEIRAWPSPYGFDVSADGRFMVVVSRMQAAAPVMTLIQNWQAGFTNRR